jgi:AcrR family transcriptional regulator
MDAPSPGLRERNRTERHQRIRAVALDAFAERGFDEVTVDEIAEAARVSKSTLFRYFPTKEHLVVADDAERLDALRSAFLDRPDHEPVTASLRAALVALASGYQDDAAEQLRRFRVIRSSPALAARILEQQAAREDALATAIASRLGARDADAMRSRLLAAAGMAVIRVALREWVLVPTDRPLGDLVAEGLDLLAEELAP